MSCTESVVSAPSTRLSTPADAVTLSGRDVLASPPSCTNTSTERVGRQGRHDDIKPRLISVDHPSSDPGKEHHVVGDDGTEVRATECDGVARVHGGGRKRTQSGGKHRPRLEVDGLFGAILNRSPDDVPPQVTPEPKSYSGQPSRVARAGPRGELSTRGSRYDPPIYENPVSRKVSILRPNCHRQGVDQKLRGRAELTIPCYRCQSDFRREGVRGPHV